jgi:metallophosphoesterase (TIGR00282 family)
VTTLTLLFFGDIVGKSGRLAVYHYLEKHPPTPNTVVLANSENVTHGFGLSENHYRELTSHGIHALTGGNHTFDRKEIGEWLDAARNVVRPANIPGQLPGTGARVMDLQGFKIGVLNLLGQSFMPNYNSPWEAMERLLPTLLAETPIVFFDFHAESTAEKNCMGRLASSMGVSCMVGTHTHVQTADERLLLDRMGYITDVGFNGSRESIIGMEPFSSLSRMRSPAPVRLEVSQEALVQVNAVAFEVDASTGTCLGVKRIHEVFELPQAAFATSGQNH